MFAVSWVLSSLAGLHSLGRGLGNGLGWSLYQSCWCRVWLVSPAGSKGLSIRLSNQLPKCGAKGKKGLSEAISNWTGSSRAWLLYEANFSLETLVWTRGIQSLSRWYSLVPKVLVLGIYFLGDRVLGSGDISKTEGLEKSLGHQELKRPSTIGLL